VDGRPAEKRELFGGHASRPALIALPRRPHRQHGTPGNDSVLQLLNVELLKQVKLSPMGKSDWDSG
jgi:hypothetical protein